MKNKYEIRKKLVDLLETISRFCLEWISENDKEIGMYVYYIHTGLAIIIGLLYVVSRVIYPAIWFQILVFIIFFVIWVQHILLNTCICTSLERRLMGKDIPLTVDIILKLFGIPVNDSTRAGVTILLSSVAVFSLFLDLVSVLIVSIRRHYGASDWI